MVKQLTITISDYVFETYLETITHNRSRYIEKLVVLGSESLLGEKEQTKLRLIKALQLNHELEQEVKNLKLQVAKQNSQLKRPKDPFDIPGTEQWKMAKMMKAIKNAGLGAGRDD